MKKNSAVEECSEADRALFRQTVGTVKSVAPSNTAPPNTAPQRRIKKTSKIAIPRSPSYVSTYEALDESHPKVSGDELLLFSRSGVPSKTIKKLKQGNYPIDREVDLHGRTISEVYAIMPQILAEAKQRQWRCLNLIHGKGYSSQGQMPMLKNALNHWLRRQQSVLVFCSAPRHLGGSGALIVLIKRQVA